jgi:hypothetical protein
MAGVQDGAPPRAYDVLRKNGFACHGAARTSGLDLWTVQLALAGGALSIVSFRQWKSNLIRLASHTAQSYAVAFGIQTSVAGENPQTVLGPHKLT